MSLEALKQFEKRAKQAGMSNEEIAALVQESRSQHERLARERAERITHVSGSISALARLWDMLNSDQ